MIVPLTRCVRLFTGLPMNRTTQFPAGLCTALYVLLTSAALHPTTRTRREARQVTAGKMARMARMVMPMMIALTTLRWPTWRHPQSQRHLQSSRLRLRMGRLQPMMQATCTTTLTATGTKTPPPKTRPRSVKAWG